MTPLILAIEGCAAGLIEIGRAHQVGVNSCDLIGTETAFGGEFCCSEALHERTREMVTSARSEALNMPKPPLIAMQPADHVEPDAKVRGRVVYDRALVKDIGSSTPSGNGRAGTTKSVCMPWSP